MDRKELFLGKYCKLEKRGGFALNGVVKDVDERGIIFETTQKISYISWEEIIELIPMKRGAP